MSLDTGKRYEITTKSGAVYVLDTGAKTMVRTPGEASFELDFDGELFEYTDLLDELTIGNPMRAVWFNKARGKNQIRTTTPMVQIREV